MSDIPKNLLDLATYAVHGEEAGERDGWGVDVDMRHAPLIATAALEPVLAELRRQVDVLLLSTPTECLHSVREVRALLGGES